TFSVLLGGGNGNFSAPSQFGTGFGPYSVAIGELNGDDRPDLVVANNGSNAAAVHLNLGTNVAVSQGPALARLELSVSPNPAIGAAGVRFVMPSAGRARVQVLDIAGRRVATLGEGIYDGGPHQLLWRRDVESGKARPGIYRVRLSTDRGTRTVKLVWLR